MTSPRPRLRIVHLVTSVRHGGAERVVLDLARCQRAAGHAPQVLCLHDRGPLASRFEEADVPVTLLDGADRPGVLRTSRQLAHWLRRHPTDVLHSHNAAPQIAGGLARQLWRAPRAQLVHTEHGHPDDLRPGFLALRRFAARPFQQFVAVSDDARERLLAIGLQAPAGVRVIRNGIDVSRFPLRPPTSPGARIVHVGRLTAIKGQDVLVEAMVKIVAALPQARLTIVGDGPDREPLRRRARQLGLHQAIRFAGAHDDVRPFLAAGDVFVLPSRSEGISIALLEAMATGLPVVATDVGGNREVLTPQSGTLVAPADPDTIASAVVATLTTPDRAARQGEAARLTVERCFNLSQAVHAYEDTYLYSAMMPSTIASDPPVSRIAT